MDVRANDISMHFNDAGKVVEVFSGLSLEVRSGESLAVTGESGVGKTTLLYILGALETPVTGEVMIGNTVVNRAGMPTRDAAVFRGRHIGFIFQFHHLFQEFSALENVAMPLFIQGEKWTSAEAKAQRLLERVGLKHRLEHRPGALSGGEQQRVAIARALITRPGVLLADEPTGNLDLKTGGEVSSLLLEMQREEGVTLVVVTHSPELAARMDRTMELTAAGMRSAHRPTA